MLVLQLRRVWVLLLALAQRLRLEPALLARLALRPEAPLLAPLALWSRLRLELRRARAPLRPQARPLAQASVALRVWVPDLVQGGPLQPPRLLPPALVRHLVPEPLQQQVLVLRLALAPLPPQAVRFIRVLAWQLALERRLLLARRLRLALGVRQELERLRL